VVGGRVSWVTTTEVGRIVSFACSLSQKVNDNVAQLGESYPWPSDVDGGMNWGCNGVKDEGLARTCLNYVPKLCFRSQGSRWVVVRKCWWALSHFVFMAVRGW
jgi:hypothetical protein